MYVERPDVESFVAPAMPVLSPSRPPATGGGSVGVPQDSVDFGSTGSAVNPPTSSGSTSAPAVDGGVIDSGSIVAAPVGTTPTGGARHGGVIDRQAVRARGTNSQGPTLGLRADVQLAHDERLAW